MKLENESRVGGVRSSISRSSLDSSGLAADGTVVKMKGLPFKTTEQEIKEFFRTHKLFDIPEEGVYMKKHTDGRPNGEAFVVFETSNSAECARGLDKKQFNEPKYGDRFVRVYPMLAADLPELQRSMQQKTSSNSSQSDWGGNGNGAQHQHDSVVRVKSLPFDANQADLLDFFASYHIKPNGVQLVVRLDGRPTGEAFVDFESYEEALKASKEKDRQVFHPKFGERYVRLILVTRQEMQRVLAERYAGEGILKLKGLPFQCTFGEVRGFFAGYQIRMSGINFVMHPDGRPTGMAFVEFESVHEAIRAMEKDKARFGPEYGDRFVMLSQSSRADMDKQILKNESEETASALVPGIHGGASANVDVGGGLGNLSWLLPPLLMAGAAGNGLNAMSGLNGATTPGVPSLQQMFGALNLNPGALNLGGNSFLPASGQQPSPFGALTNGSPNAGNLPIPGSQISLQELGAAWLSQNMDPQLSNLLHSINSSSAIGQDNFQAINSNSNGNTGESGSLGSSVGLLKTQQQANNSSSEFAPRNQNDSGDSRRSSFESFANGQAYSNGNGSGNSNDNNNFLAYTAAQKEAFCKANVEGNIASNAFLMNQAAQQRFGDKNSNAINNAFVMNQVAQQSSFYSTSGQEAQQQQAQQVQQPQQTWGGLSLH